MTRIRITLTVLGAVAAFSVLSVSSASAGWLINGTPLTGSAALSTQALVDRDSTLLIPGLGLSILCNGHFLDFTSPQLIGTDKFYASSLTFLGCSTITPTSCEIEGQPTAISTTAILALAHLWTKGGALLLITPETKTTFTNIEFKAGDECAFKGLEPVTGSVVAGAPTGQSSLAAQSVTGLGSTEGNNSLQVGGQKAFIDGGLWLLTLASGAKWSFD
jgi:hypothetical protein